MIKSLVLDVYKNKPEKTMWYNNHFNRTLVNIKMLWLEMINDKELSFDVYKNKPKKTIWYDNITLTALF